MNTAVVHAVTKTGRGRYLVQLEDGMQLPLSEKELHAFGIAEGEPLTETVQEALSARLKKRARSYALHLLERMDRTELQLREKLRQQLYPESIADDAVAYVKSFRYLDDLRYARNYLELQGRQKSMRRMEQELYAKGISAAVFRLAAQEAELPDEQAQIQALLEKKHYDPASCGRKEKERLYGFLLRRGYALSAVKQAMDLYDAD